MIFALYSISNQQAVITTIKKNPNTHTMPPPPPSTVVVLDNGAGYIKAGTSGERSPTLTLPNCTAKPPSTTSKKPLLPTHLLDPSIDLTSSIIKRPFDRGHLINPDLQSTIWAHIFNTLNLNPQKSSLLLTEPFFQLPAVSRAVDELVFEHFGFMGLFVSDGASLVHLYEASKRPYDVVAKSGCSLVVDVGFSFGHVVPVVKDVVCNYGVKRMDLGGKALTNYLKELVSYRSVNVMDETFLMDDVKEKLCFVSSDVARDLQIARRRGNDNHFRCTYVLPDGITHTKGYVKDPEEAQKYLKLSEDGELPHPEGTDQADETEVTNKPTERNKVDLTKNEFSLTNERFLVPEMIFRPADLGMNQAGLAECIVRAVNSCHPHLHPVLYESIILTGGSTLFPGFTKRLESELRPLVPDVYQVKITTQEEPMLGAWRGGSLLASSPDFDAMCVTKAEYEELGSYRCRRRFFH